MGLAMAVRAKEMRVIGPEARAQAGSSRRRFRGAPEAPSIGAIGCCGSIRRLQRGLMCCSRGWFLRRHNHRPRDSRSPRREAAESCACLMLTRRTLLLRVLAPCSGI